MHWLEVVEWRRVNAHLQMSEVGCLIIYKHEGYSFELHKIDLSSVGYITSVDYIKSDSLDGLLETALRTLTVTWGIDLETALQLTKIQHKLKIILLEPPIN